MTQHWITWDDLCTILSQEPTSDKDAQEALLTKIDEYGDRGCDLATSIEKALDIQRL